MRETNERDQLLTKITNLTEERDQLLTKITNLTEERDQLLTKITNLTERDQLLTKITNLTDERDQLLTKITNLTDERDQLLTKITNLTDERDQLLTKITNLTDERDQLLTKITNLTEERDQLLTKITNLTEERDQLLTKITNLTDERDQLLTKITNLTEERDLLLTNNMNLTEERNQLKSEKSELQKFSAGVCQFFSLNGGWKCHQSSLYFISSETKSWTESRRYCTDRRADLIIINNTEEQDFVKDISGGDLVWIGLTDRDVEGKWKWVDGSDVTSGFWEDGQPNIPQTKEEVCALIHSPEWADFPCGDNSVSSTDVIAKRDVPIDIFSQGGIAVIGSRFHTKVAFVL
ncbi:CD209 antigen-like protein B [Onychostoma macrolepis]|uniref:CD209 antigen-like protein B n=1 Tax=Onychostoma macrolepis TaxID=369639 RepID=UPI00272B65D2|nr:CD209 antigen-like protein B [Onychostoma macrolepis]